MSTNSNLRTIAQGATPGPWQFWSNIGVQCTDLYGKPVGQPLGQSHQGVKFGHGNQTITKEADSRFIATFDPPTVLALLDVIECYENALRRLSKDDIGSLTSNEIARAARRDADELFPQKDPGNG